MIVPIEGDNPDKSGAIQLTLTVSGGYTAPMLQSIIPAIPGLADWKCHVNTNYGEVRTLKLFRNSYFFAPPSTGFVLDFSANVGRFPDGSVTIHTAAQVIQIARYAGLAGRAMRLGVSEGGYATTIDLLEIGWEQKYVYVS